MNDVMTELATENSHVKFYKVHVEVCWNVQYLVIINNYWMIINNYWARLLQNIVSGKQINYLPKSRQKQIIDQLDSDK